MLGVPTRYLVQNKQIHSITKISTPHTKRSLFLGNSIVSGLIPSIRLSVLLSRPPTAPHQPRNTFNQNRQLINGRRMYLSLCTTRSSLSLPPRPEETYINSLPPARPPTRPPSLHPPTMHSLTSPPKSLHLHKIKPSDSHPRYIFSVP